MSVFEKTGIQFRLIRYYTRAGYKCEVICSAENVDMVYEKYRKLGYETMEIGKHTDLCNDCQYTACWDKGQVVRCSIKKKVK